MRFLAGEEPEVVQATARLASPEVDRRMDAEFRFPSGVTGHITASLLSSTLLRIGIHVTGERGEMGVLNFVTRKPMFATTCQPLPPANCPTQMGRFPYQTTGNPSKNFHFLWNLLYNICNKTSAIIDKVRN
jgi:hypothetical protein